MVEKDLERLQQQYPRLSINTPSNQKKLAKALKDNDRDGDFFKWFEEAIGAKPPNVPTKEEIADVESVIVMKYKSIVKKVSIDDLWMSDEFSIGDDHRIKSMFYSILKTDVERNGMLNPFLCIEEVRDLKKMCEDEKFNRNYQEHLSKVEEDRPFKDWVRDDGAPYKLIGGTEKTYGTVPYINQDAGGKNRFLVVLELGFDEVEIRILPDDKPETIDYYRSNLIPTNVDNILGMQ